MSEHTAKRVVARYVETNDKTIQFVEATKALQRKLQLWIKTFPLKEAKKNNPPSGWLWQDPFVGFFETFETFQDSLNSISKDISEIPELAKLRIALKISKNADIDKAMELIDFAKHPETGSDQIIYSEARVLNWFNSFSNWFSAFSKVLGATSRRQLPAGTNLC